MRARGPYAHKFEVADTQPRLSRGLEDAYDGMFPSVAARILLEAGAVQSEGL